MEGAGRRSEVDNGACPGEIPIHRVQRIVYETIAYNMEDTRRETQDRREAAGCRKGPEDGELGHGSKFASGRRRKTPVDQEKSLDTSE